MGKRRRLSSDSKSESADHIGKSCPELPVDIINSILVKLPVKTLIRLSTLSKQYLQIITSSHFETQHMRSLTCSTASCNVICLSYTFRGCRISSEEYNGSYELFNMPFKHINFYADHTLYISCNGLLCVAEIAGFSNASCLSVWNPAIGKCRKVVWPRMENYPTLDFMCSLMGFGYDSSIDDYKIVLLSTMQHTTLVMSLKENKWRKVDFLNINGYDFTKYSMRDSVSVDGVVYWYFQYFYHLLRFDLTTESFSFLPLPKGGTDDNRQYKLATLGNLLYFFVWEFELPPNILRNRRNPYQRMVCKIDIWMLQDKSIWSKVGTIPTQNYRLRQGRHNRPVGIGIQQKLNPLGFNLRGHVIMVNRFDNSLVVYIPQEKRFLKLDVKDSRALSGNLLLMHMETLVSP